MKVALKCLGIPLEGLEKGPFELNMEDGSTIKDLVDELMKISPALTQEHFNTTSFMINQNKAYYKSTLHDGDQVLVLRILGGG